LVKFLKVVHARSEPHLPHEKASPTKNVSPTKDDAKDTSLTDTSEVEDMKKEFLAYIASLQSEIEKGRATILAQKSKIRRLESLLTEQMLQNAQMACKKHKVNHHGEAGS
jgi:predicted  nucleic acid-binding Zn-ribbon protein